MKLPVALQVYSVRDDAAADLMGVLAQIKKMGYDGVEFAGLYDVPVEDVKKKLDELDLKAMSMHVSLDIMLNDYDKLLHELKTLECPWVAIPALGPDRYNTPEAWENTKKLIAEVGEKLKKDGITLLYHNHNFEFNNRFGGKYMLDDLYSSVCSSVLETELDTCWVNVGGECPVGYIKKYEGRCPVVHLKDFTLDAKLPENIKNGPGRPDTFDFRPVGYGVQNMPAIVEAAVESGAQWVVVEQDRSLERPALEAARMSVEFLKSL